MTRTHHFANCLGVFQGGGCKALAFVGAYQEAVARGVYFSQVSGTSAGSIVAALIAAGATPEYLSNAILETDLASFKQPADTLLFSPKAPLLARTFKRFPGKYGRLASIATHLGLYSSKMIETWLEGHLRTLLAWGSTKKITFSDLHVPLHVIATHLHESRPAIWSTEITPDVSVSYAVRCSCSVPIFFQPVDGRYVDGGVVSNLPAFVLSQQVDRGFEKVLCFAFGSEADGSASESSELIQQSRNLTIEEYVSRLASAAIDGAVSIQGDLQGDLHFVTLKSLPLDTLDFDRITPESLQEMFHAGRMAAREFFDEETANLRRNSHRRSILMTETQTLNHLVRNELAAGDWLTFCIRTNRFVYNLFPSLLYWRTEGVNIQFILPRQFAGKVGDEDHEKLRSLVLLGLGCQLSYADRIPFECVTSVARDHRKGSTTVLLPKRVSHESAGYAVTYDSADDSDVIELIQTTLEQLDPRQRELGPFVAEFLRLDPEELFVRLRDVEQYRNAAVTFALEEVPIEKIVFLSKYVKSYKYSQIGRLFGALDSNSVGISDCAWLRFRAPKWSFNMPVTPPVAEAHGAKYFLLDGNSRLTYLARERQASTVKLIVVKNVTSPLPSSGRYPAKGLVVSDERKIGATRYDDFKWGFYRNIEKAARNPSHYSRMF